MWGSFFKAVFTGKHKLSPVTYIGVLGALAYTIWPVDISPDIIPFLGWIDDLGLWGVVAAIFGWERGRFETAVRKGSVESSASNPTRDAAE